MTRAALVADRRGGAMRRAAAVRDSLPADGRPSYLRALALALAAVPGAVAWAGMVAGFGARVVPVVVVAAVVASLPRPERAGAVALVVWLAAAPLLAGVTGIAPARVLTGARDLAMVSAAPIGRDPWALASALLLAGAAWLAAPSLAPGPGYAAAVLPWVGAIALGPPDAAVWQGGAIAAGAVLWFAAPRVRAPAALALGLTLALISSAAAQAVAPKDRWFRLPGALDHSRPRFRSLATEPTFGPLADRRGGATMLEVTADTPTLWRMQTLGSFDGVTWRAASSEPMLPEPAAVRSEIDVRVRGLQDDLVISPGRVESVLGPGLARPLSGEAWSLTPAPRSGATYRVTSDAVSADATELRLAPPPSDPRLLQYTSIHGGPPSVLRIGNVRIPLPIGFPLALAATLEIDTPLWGEPASPRARALAAATPYGPVAALARGLAAGARTEYDVVDRVQRYLLGGGRFHYTTDVPKPGRYPLADFLLRTHAGYCQHFAGAAALLLRLAGIPARVVAGFATGLARGDHYDVRDVDAHDWIEVYFTGVGWVPFNPTPAAAPAALPARFGGGPAGTHRGGSPLVLAAAAAAAAALALAAARRSRRLDPAERLARLLDAGPGATLGDIRTELERRVGPHTAALAGDIERARFAPPVPQARETRPAQRAGPALARALARDIGALRAVRMLIRSAR